MTRTEPDQNADFEHANNTKWFKVSTSYYKSAGSVLVKPENEPSYHSLRTTGPEVAPSEC